MSSDNIKPAADATPIVKTTNVESKSGWSTKKTFGIVGGLVGLCAAGVLAVTVVMNMGTKMEDAEEKEPENTQKKEKDKPINVELPRMDPGKIKTAIQEYRDAVKDVLKNPNAEKVEDLNAASMKANMLYLIHHAELATEDQIKLAVAINVQHEQAVAALAVIKPQTARTQYVIDTVVMRNSAVTLRSMGMTNMERDFWRDQEKKK